MMSGGGFGEHGLLRQAAPRVRTPLTHSPEHLLNIGRGRTLVRLTAQLVVVVVLLCLAAANMYVRSTWSEPEDGVLWKTTADGGGAEEIAGEPPPAPAGGS